MVASSLVCAGCGLVPPPLEEQSYPFRCARASPAGAPVKATGSPDVDHVVRRVLNPVQVAWPGGVEPNPFLRYRRLLHAYHVARGRGLSDGDLVALVERLDRAVAGVDGRGFAATPFEPQDALAAAVGLRAGRLWVKDETGNVSGSHKARHLMGVAIYLEVVDALGLRPARQGPLAIASCGNAALAAAVLARAAGRELQVFVPTWAEAPVVAALTRLGARVTVCSREAGVAGDPCYLRFRDAIGRGAVPFCCQGPDNGLTIEGGETIAWEMIDALGGRTLDRLFVQVGGGALASACAQGFADAARLGRLARLPRLHTVQTRGGFPLARAYDRLACAIAERLDLPAPVHDSPAARADAILARAGDPIVGKALADAATHRSAYMWPWETEPRSIAHSILDDETYDWMAVCEEMIRTGGYPVVVDEDTLMRANALARDTTGVDVDHTGTAGLAGLMQMVADGADLGDETIALLFTGVRRSVATG